jgi:hypothetical protein
VQTKLLGGITVVLNNGTVLLRLGDTKFRPETNSLVGEGLYSGDATRILLINSCELAVKLVNVCGGEIKVGGDRLIRSCRWQRDLDKGGFQVGRVGLEGHYELCMVSVNEGIYMMVQQIRTLYLIKALLVETADLGVLLLEALKAS